MAVSPSGRIEQYLDRAADLVVFHGVQPAGSVALEMALAQSGTGGAVVVGPQKVVQRFLLELFRERGTMPFNPRGGTDFLSEARMGYLRTATDVVGAFARAVVDIRRILASEETSADPPDERFRDAKLLSVTVSNLNARLRILVETRAGTSREFVFPLPAMV